MRLGASVSVFCVGLMRQGASYELFHLDEFENGLFFRIRITGRVNAARGQQADYRMHKKAA